MYSILARVRSAALETRARIVRRINAASASVFTAASAAYAAYPDSVKAFLRQIPEWLVFPAAVGFFLFIHSALKHPKDGKDAS